MTLRPLAVGHEPLRLRVRHQRHVVVLQRGPHASHVRVGLSVREAGEAVEPVAADAAARLGVGLVQVHADGQVERPVPGLLEVIGELLDARLVRHRRVRKRPGPRRLGRVLARLPVHEIELLRLCVVGLEILIGDRPRRREAAVVVNLAEVPLTQAEQDRSVELGVAADEVLLVGLEGLAILVVPDLIGQVAVLLEDLAAVPVLWLARQVAAAL